MLVDVNWIWFIFLDKVFILFMIFVKLLFKVKEKLEVWIGVILMFNLIFWLDRDVLFIVVLLKLVDGFNCRLMIRLVDCLLNKERLIFILLLMKWFFKLNLIFVCNLGCKFGLLKVLDIEFVFNMVLFVVLKVLGVVVNMLWVLYGFG